MGKKLKSPTHFYAKTNDRWDQNESELTMLGQPETEVLVFSVGASYVAGKKEQKTGVPVLMVRRRNVKQTDFVAFFSVATKSVERVPVKKADGGDAAAVGVKITLKEGKIFHAVVNYEPEGTSVVVGELETRKRFATDYELPED